MCSKISAFSFLVNFCTWGWPKKVQSDRVPKLKIKFEKKKKKKEKKKKTSTTMPAPNILRKF
jgi:hypothetical protein